MRPSSTHAVSAVVGVMLMLVVVIIIAAVVAGFSGGMVGTSDQKPPNLILDVKIVNTGIWQSSGFFANVVVVDKPVLTKDLKIVTSWTLTNRTTGERKTGGATVIPNVQNINHDICNAGQWQSTFPTRLITAPFGSGTGVADIDSFSYGSSYNNGQVQQKYWFGQYTLTPGTTISAPTQHCLCNCFWDSVCPTATNNCRDSGAYGARQLYQYPDPTFIDPAVAVLGPGWNDLRAGDIVNVKVVHIPTNKPIFEKNILVVEG